MPKTFPIYLEVEQMYVGAVLDRLRKTPGIAKMDLDLVAKSDGKPRKPNGHRKPQGRFEVPGDIAIMQLLNGKPPMSSSQVGEAFGAQGRSPKSISSCLHKLRTAGLINSTHEGYSLTKKGRDRMRAKRK
jgi:hypothetical protein